MLTVLSKVLFYEDSDRDVELEFSLRLIFRFVALGESMQWLYSSAVIYISVIPDFQYAAHHVVSLFPTMT